MRGRRPRADLGFQRLETRRLGAAAAGGAMLFYLLMASVIIVIAMVTAVRPERAGSSRASQEAVLMTLGDADRPSSWEDFFARHPLPDDAIRDRILSANEAIPADVVCVPLDAEVSDPDCR